MDEVRRRVSMGRLSVSAGRAVTFAVAVLLVLMVLAGVYVFFAQRNAPLPGVLDDDPTRQGHETKQLFTLLMVLLGSALLILLFVVGAYFVIHLGQFISRQRVGGKPTEYVDAWQNYRLSDADISAATDEPSDSAEDSEEHPPP
jgi:uncharacterized membrane protein